MDLKFLAIIFGIAVLVMGPAIIGAFPISLLIGAIAGGVFLLSDAFKKR